MLVEHRYWPRLHDAMTRIATNRLSRRLALGLAFALMAVVWAVPAEAHVKWVVEFDITKPPRRSAKC